MATTNTTTLWHWYIRLRGGRFLLGLVDENGAAPTTAGLDITVFYQSWPDEISSDSDQIGLPSEFLHVLAKSVASEILKMNGGVTALTQQYDLLWERGIYDALHLAIDESKQPMTQYPINLRVNE